ncbi:pyridoxamine 5'-phosphate oxidase family protein, partial [Escherichia coli]|uniref:pyridoxamine 5'-phosphate oxidase family protein n=2 Tax=Pseudomonadota TaxID=1224 RepID=UPI003D3654BE
QLDGDEDRGPIYFFTSKDTELVADLKHDSRAVATFASKGNDVFATIHGTLVAENDRAVIDRLWNSFVAAWYEGGKDDP